MKLLISKFKSYVLAKWFKWIRRANYIPKVPLFFIHIPKTAGTSCRMMLSRHIDQKVTFPNLLDLGDTLGTYPNIETLKTTIAELDRDIKFMTGHYPFAVGDYLPFPRQYFVFLREPVARTISNLLHFKRKQAACRDLSLSEIFEKHKYHFHNLQTRFLCDPSLDELTTFFRPDLLSEKSLEQAKANLEKCTFIGITEDFENSMKIVEHLLGAKLGRQLKSNAAPKKDLQFDPNLVKQLKPHLKLDFELYDHGLMLFDRQKSLIIKG